MKYSMATNVQNLSADSDDNTEMMSEAPPFSRIILATGTSVGTATASAFEAVSSNPSFYASLALLVLSTLSGVYAFSASRHKRNRERREDEISAIRLRREQRLEEEELRNKKAGPSTRAED